MRRKGTQKNSYCSGIKMTAGGNLTVPPGFKEGLQWSKQAHLKLTGRIIVYDAR
jgi:hypothetical protein